jgi:dTMP kinase
MQLSSLMLNHYPTGNVELEMKSTFIVIEGLDGSGKTTQAKTLARKLRQSHDAVYTLEPSNGRIGAFIRRRILYGDKRPPIAVEALLFAADRLEHVQNEILPKLSKGQMVISDRYIYSSLAYQGSEGLSLDWIQTINQGVLKPDLAFFIDAEPEIVLKRLKRKKSIMENIETQQKVREVYLKYVSKGELVRINGNKPIKTVAEDVLRAVTEFLMTQTRTDAQDV